MRKILSLLGLIIACASLPGAESRYESRNDPDRDGTGKFYMGRHIAHVMGHEGADWLERPSREEEERPMEVLKAIKLQPGNVVADIGAGTGYFSWRMAREVGPGGKVYAVEIQQEMLDLLAVKMKERGVTNVIGALGTISDPKLPEGQVDLIIMVDVYHEFSHPYEMLEGMYKALKPGGRIVFVEYKGEDPEVPIKRVHKMTEAQVRKEVEVFPFTWQETISSLPRQHVIIFKKK